MQYCCAEASKLADLTKLPNTAEFFQGKIAAAVDE
jgi:hypothetical protein